MLPVITRPTRVTHSSATLIDNLYINSNRIDTLTSGILTLDISDHFPVFVFFGKKNCRGEPPVMIKYRRINDNAITNLQDMLIATDWSMLDTLDVDKQFERLVEILNMYLDECAPQKHIQIPYKYAIRNKWMSRELLNSFRHLRKLRRLASGRNNEHEAVIEYKRYRNLYNRSIRAAKNTYYCELLASHTGDISKTWKTLNELIGKSHDKTSCTSIKIDNGVITDTKQISNTFCEFFTTVGQKCAESIPAARMPFTHHLTQAYNHSFFLSPVTPGDLISIISRMKSKSSYGNDNISSKLLKSIRGEIAYPLSVVINNSLSSGIVPHCMKIAKVIPLYKAKDKQILSNYRPISLLPVLSKVLEKTVYLKLAKFLEMHNILFESQYGFRKGHSTIHGVAEFVQHTVKSMDNKYSTISVLLDLSKAFDTINHDILIHKLNYYGIRGVSLNWFRSYLSNRSQFVSCNGQTSVVEHITCGVPQGSVLGPLLFLIYMNDLPTCLNFTSTVLFADDTTIYASSDNIIDLYRIVNLDLDNLVDWFRSNKLALNTSKTTFMLFTNSRNIPVNQVIKIDTDVIERKNCCKFLGLLIDDKLSWSEHI